MSGVEETKAEPSLPSPAAGDVSRAAEQKLPPPITPSPQQPTCTLTNATLVASWAWDVTNTVCSICRNDIMQLCIHCQAQMGAERDKCVVAWGACSTLCSAALYASVHTFTYICRSLVPFSLHQSLDQGQTGLSYGYVVGGGLECPGKASYDSQSSHTSADNQDWVFQKVSNQEEGKSTQ